MNLTLIEGKFTPAESIDIISKMVAVKIKFHEEKINNNHNQEDIKMREKKIKSLQHELDQLRQHMKSQTAGVNINAAIQMN